MPTTRPRSAWAHRGDSRRRHTTAGRAHADRSTGAPRTASPPRGSGAAARRPRTARSRRSPASPRPQRAACKGFSGPAGSSLQRGRTAAFFYQATARAIMDRHHLTHAGDMREVVHAMIGHQVFSDILRNEVRAGGEDAAAVTIAVLSARELRRAGARLFRQGLELGIHGFTLNTCMTTCAVDGRGCAFQFMLRVLLARDLASHKKVGDLLRVRRGAKDLALVVAECLDPAPDVARVRLGIMWHTELGREHGARELGAQLLLSISLIAKAAEAPVEPALVPGPVAELVQCGAIVVTRRRELRQFRQMNGVFLRNIEGGVATMTNVRARAGDDALGGRVRIPAGGPQGLSIERRDALDLLRVEHGVGAQHRDGALLGLAGIGIDLLLVRDLDRLIEADLCAGLAFAYLPTLFLRLFVGAPARVTLAPEQQGVDAVIGTARDGVHGESESGAVPPRALPGRGAALEGVQNAFGHLLVYVAMFGHGSVLLVSPDQNEVINITQSIKFQVMKSRGTGRGVEVRMVETGVLRGIAYTRK